MRRLAIVALALTASCAVDTPNYNGVEFRCSAERACQDEMQCVAGWCSLGDDAATDAGIDAPPGTDVDASISTCLPVVAIQDTFDGPEIPTKWTVSRDVGTNAEIVSGQLVLTATSSNPSRFVSLRSEALDFDERRAFVEITQMVDVSTRALAEMRALLGGQNYYSITQQEGALTFGKTVSNGSVTLESISYDPEAHRFWQLRKEGARMYADLSADGKTWVNLGSTVTADIVGDLQLDIRAGTETNIGAPGAMHITNVNNGNGLCP